MGRHPWTNRLTVEDCPIFLSVVSFHRDRLFTSPTYDEITTSWMLAGCSTPLARLTWRLEYRGPTGLALCVPLQFAREDIYLGPQVIPIETTRPHLGGQRFWFLCQCGRRVGRLYLPPAEKVFRCRTCYNLTYRSTQTHDQRVYDLAWDFACDPTAIDAAFESEKFGRKFLAINAMALCLKRLNRRLRKLPVCPEIPMVPYPLP